MVLNLVIREVQGGRKLIDSHLVQGIAAQFGFKHSRFDGMKRQMARCCLSHHPARKLKADPGAQRPN